MTWLAAAVLLYIGAMHSYLGERFLFPRLFRLADLPLFHADRAYTENVLRFAWHLTSLAWWGVAAALIAWTMFPGEPRPLLIALGAVPFASGLVILATCGFRHPAWSLFLIAGGLIWYSSV